MKTLTVRLPDDLYERLQKEAKRQRRSMNQTVVVLVEQQCPFRGATRTGFEPTGDLKVDWETLMRSGTKAAGNE